MIKNFLFIALFISFNSISQSLEEVAKAASIGLIDRVDVFEELNNRGMTEEDARRMARIYGIS